MAANAHTSFMTEQEFKDHTKQIALRVIQLVEELPNNQKAQIIGDQLLRSASSIGANYLAACRGRSTDELLQRLCAVEEEAYKSLYWLEVLVDAKIVLAAKLSALNNDLDEIVSMTASSINTIQLRRKRDNVKLRL